MMELSAITEKPESVLWKSNYIENMRIATLELLYW